jgi:hypothetical protein
MAGMIRQVEISAVDAAIEQWMIVESSSDFARVPKALFVVLFFYLNSIGRAGDDYEAARTAFDGMVRHWTEASVAGPENFRSAMASLGDAIQKLRRHRTVSEGRRLD